MNAVMHCFKRIATACLLLVAPTLSAGCDGGGNAGVSQATVTVFAAASTGDAIEAINKLFSEETGITVRTSAAGSSTLAQQIEHGAPADLFLSANEKWCDYVDQQKLVARRCDLLGNQLAIVVPISAERAISSPTDLPSDQVEHLALADPQAVPAGIYAKQALEQLGLWDRIQAKVVPGKDVRAALAYVETAAAEAGVVYTTDAAASRSVEIAYVFPTDLTEPIVYPLALLKAAEEKPSAVRYFEFLTSSQAAEVFAAHGFATITASPAAEP